MNEGLYKRILDSLYDGVYLVDTGRRITYWNRGAERITGYGADEAVGRRCQDDFLVHVDADGLSLCRHGCPLAWTMADGRPREAEVFLQHKAGHRVPVSARAAPLYDAAGAVEGAVEIFSDNSRAAAIDDLVTELRQLALLDPVTEVGNRRFLEQQLKARLDEWDRYGRPVGVLFVDVDRFKEVNDRHGHAAGDRVLRMVARTLANSVRSFDTVGRWGGEEFVALIVNVDEEQLRSVGEKLRRLVEGSGFDEDGKAVRVTVSIGGIIASPGEDPEAAVRRADRRMYESKRTGRNRVTV